MNRAVGCCMLLGAVGCWMLWVLWVLEAVGCCLCFVLCCRCCLGGLCCGGGERVS